MIKILILEDSSDKATRIANILNTLNGNNYTLVTDLISARKYLQEVYDLLILDMNLPERFNDTPRENNGIEFLHEIKQSQRLKSPKNIIGITEFDNLHTRFKDEFNDNALSLIKYDITSSKWAETLKEKVNYLIKVNSQDTVLKYDYDVAFLTALRRPEFESILKLDYKWERFTVSNDPSIYYRGKIITGNSVINIVSSYLPQMGMSAAAVSAMKIIEHFRPKYLIMSGICGGVKKKVDLGDVVISDLSFDMGSGKISMDENGIEFFEADYKSIPLSGELKSKLIEFSSDTQTLRSIKDTWMGPKLNSDMRVHVGPMGTCAAVIANSDYLQKIIQHQRKLLAIDMESYSIFYCCENSNNPKPVALVIKVVSDFADSHKNDDIQEYSSFISANVSDYIIKNLLKY